MNLRQFYQGPDRNRWIKEGPLKIYVRKANRYIGSVFVRTLDVANVSSSARGQGYFKDWLTDAEATAKEYGAEAIYVESLLNVRLEESLRKWGYLSIQGTYPPSMFKPL